MTRAAYHRPLDQPQPVTLAMIHPAQVHVRDLRVGDVIVRPECIPLTVSEIRPEICGLICIGYTCGPNDCLADYRTLVAGSIVTILPRADQASH